MVNINRLKGKIVEKGETLESIAIAIGMNPSTLYRKFKNPNGAFSIKEADDIVSYLHLGSEEATAIFFSQFVA